MSNEHDTPPPLTGTCRCGRRILNAGKGWYHHPDDDPPIGHYPEPIAVVAR